MTYCDKPSVIKFLKFSIVLLILSNNTCLWSLAVCLTLLEKKQRDSWPSECLKCSVNNHGYVGEMKKVHTKKYS